MCTNSLFCVEKAVARRLFKGMIRKSRTTPRPAWSARLNRTGCAGLGRRRGGAGSLLTPSHITHLNAAVDASAFFQLDALRPDLAVHHAGFLELEAALGDDLAGHM